MKALRNVNNVRALEDVVQVRKSRILLGNLDVVIVADLREMPFQHNPGHGTCRRCELVLGKFFRCVQL